MDLNKKFKKSSLFDVWLFKLKLFIKSQSETQIQLFPKSNYSFAFNPVQLTGGLFVLLILFISIVTIGTQLTKPQIADSQLIKNLSVIPSTNIVAQGQPIKWTAIISRSDITNTQNKLKLPKQATHIKVSSITTQQANDILFTKPQEQLTLGQRQQLAQANTNKQNQFFLADLFSSISRFFVGSIADGVDSIVEQTTQDVVVTEDAKVVDLSSEVLPETCLLYTSPSPRD